MLKLLLDCSMLCKPHFTHADLTLLGWVPMRRGSHGLRRPRGCTQDGPCLQLQESSSR